MEKDDAKDEDIIENWDINFEELTANDVELIEFRSPKVVYLFIMSLVTIMGLV